MNRTRDSLPKGAVRRLRRAHRYAGVMIGTPRPVIYYRPTTNYIYSANGLTRNWR